MRGDRTLHAALVVLALAGLGIAGYLTYVHYAELSPVCTTGGCERVQSSRYAKVAGVPVPLIGLIGYVAILASLAVLRGETGRLARVAMTAGGFAFSAYLTYLELFVIDAICQWCVASAVIMTALLVLAVIDFLHPPAAATPAAPGTARSPARR